METAKYEAMSKKDLLLFVEVLNELSNSQKITLLDHPLRCCNAPVSMREKGIKTIIATERGKNTEFQKFQRIRF